MPAHTADTAPSTGATAVSTAVALDGHTTPPTSPTCSAACASGSTPNTTGSTPLLAKHDYDITGLRVALDRHTALLRCSDDQPPF